ncbi:hypothetical protein Y900_018795 [Mycolicibacterium aromaticivorans JS19b1 = JCM 16368]|uniref:PKD domain-containing protein n=1 Tax=Mycolicibacterium aromaticivorans JS19b1 = JCM 16368 TaxID=1440774 RepID=A0A064CK24_9MYCO|nr:hypothetical protein [Mycolicibacterium aromaticivorans]KDF00925.1 hypothetical protein Y900_018795 [Mycolicibacterium aromaticivorans JS19b1 = JCM 16368]
MHVVAFAAARKAVLEEAGGVTAEGFPMTSCYVESLPSQITVPLVLAVHAQGGSDYEPRRFIVAKSPEGERVGLLEFAWQWPDNPGLPVKFRVFAHHLPITVYSAGVYSVGLYSDPDGAQAEFEFPLPVLRLNPLTGVLQN